AAWAGTSYPARQYRLGSFSAGYTLQGRSARVRIRWCNAEWIAAEIVVPGGAEGRRHSGRRNEAGEGCALTLHFGLIIEEEKCLIPLDGAAQRTSKLIQME